MKMRVRTRNKFFEVANEIMAWDEKPAESHIFMALMQEQDNNPLDIMQSTPPQFVDVASIPQRLTGPLLAGNNYYFMMRVATCDSTPACFRTDGNEIGMICKDSADVYFPANIDSIKKNMAERPLQIRKAEIQSALADSFRKLCIASGYQDDIARVENQILRGILYRAFYAHLPKMDGIVAGRFVFNLALAVSEPEMAAIQTNVKKWQSICAEPDLATQTNIKNCFTNSFGNLAVSLYNTAAEIGKMLDN